MQLATQFMITVWLVAVVAYELARFYTLEADARQAEAADVAMYLERAADRQSIQVASHVGAATFLIIFLWLFL